MNCAMTNSTDCVLQVGLRLHELCKTHSHFGQFISVGKINEAKLGNFRDIDAMVIIACPSVSFFDVYTILALYSTHMHRPLTHMSH